MTEKKNAANETEAATDGDAPESGVQAAPSPEPAEEVGASVADPDAVEPSREQELADENTELKDRLLRAAAEMENLRKRTEREVRDARQYAVTAFARDLLGVADNMRRALEAVPEAERAAAATVIEGVEMTERELLKAFEKHGVRRLDPQGEKFDPNLHQAMFEVPDESVASGTVVQVVQSGYVLADRVLRPAMVGVSKGGPKTGAGAAAERSTVDRRA